MQWFLFIAVTAVWSLYAQVLPGTPSGCAAVGVVFDVDLTRRALMVKDKTGFIATIDLPAKVAIHKMAVGGGTPGRIDSRTFSKGDLVCSKATPQLKHLTR